MSIDTAVVALIVALCAAFVLRRAYRSYQAARQPANGCGSDCGCGDHAPVSKHQA